MAVKLQFWVVKIGRVWDKIASVLSNLAFFGFMITSSKADMSLLRLRIDSSKVKMVATCCCFGSGDILTDA
jgi:hypothetical protein